MILFTYLGKLSNGKMFLIFLECSGKRKPIRDRVVMIPGFDPEFLMIGNKVLVSSGRFNEIVEDDAIIAYTINSGWPKEFFFKELKYLMKENIVYDSNLNPKGG